MNSLFSEILKTAERFPEDFVIPNCVFAEDNGSDLVRKLAEGQNVSGDFQNVYFFPFSGGSFFKLR
jgi:hypothetical protein